MKAKNRWKLLILGLVLWMITGLGQAENAKNPRKLTLMIYMCGSNLESLHGAASMDLLEMSAAGAGSAQVSVLVMAGGTNSWTNGYDPDKATILELRGGRIRAVYTDEKRNMGEAATLQFFLQYGKDHYPADDYALILWDHGGGVLDGVCIDEQYSDDRLSYPELKEAIMNVDLGQKLSWIGFDACLMSSLEIAADLSSVADYMIASQETEPGTGWNYAFLGGIEKDSSSAETGKRIVDAYFEGQEKNKGILTLACIELSKAEEAARILSDFFARIEKSISADSYPAFASVRVHTREFGSSLKQVQGDKGYDLVDAVDLLRQMDGDPDLKETALNLLQSAVVYHRATAEPACGLTLYHPWQNMKTYKEQWGSTYQSLSLIDGYAKYVESFGTLLTGKVLVLLRNLYTESDGRDLDENHLFSLPLTAEEASHIASAQLIVVKQDMGKSTLSDSVVVLGAAPAQMTEGGTLQASYEERELYIQTGDGEILGPVGYYQTPDGKYNVVRAGFVAKEDVYGWPFGDPLEVLYYLDADDLSENPPIVRTRVWDDTTQSFSSRMPLELEKYRLMEFLEDNRIYPEAENGVLPDFYEWEHSSFASVTSVPLPNEWRFVFRQRETKKDQLYAMFRITDVQQNVYCSIPVPIENDSRYAIQMTPGELNGQDYRIRIKGYIDQAEGHDMRVEISAKNTGRKDARFIIQKISLNQEREIDWFQIGGTRLDAGQTKIYQIGLDPIDLTTMGKVETLDIQYSWTTDENEISKQVSFQLKGVNLDHVEPVPSIGRAESEGVTIDLYRIEQGSDGELSISALVQNNSGSVIETGDFIVNGIQLAGNASCSIGSGKSKMVQYRWENGLLLYNGRLRWTELQQPYSYVSLINQWLSQRGETEAVTFGALFSKPDDPSSAVFLNGKLTSPQFVQKIDQPADDRLFIGNGFPKESVEVPHLLPLLDEAKLKIDLRNMVIGKNVVVLVLQAENKTDESLRMKIGHCSVNRVPDSVEGTDYEIAPGCVKAIAVEISSEFAIGDEMEIHELSFSCLCDGEPERPIALRLKDPTGVGKLGQIIWVDADQIDLNP